LNRSREGKIKFAELIASTQQARALGPLLMPHQGRNCSLISLSEPKKLGFWQSPNHE
jgi:hypothetical protein